MAAKKNPKTFKRNNILSRKLSIVLGFMILFAGIGAYFLFKGHAVTPQGTYTNWNWNAPAEGFSSLRHSLTIQSVTPDAPYFWSHQFQFIGGDGGYIGLQSRGNRVDGSVGKTAIFSIFSAGIEATPGACSVEQAGFDGYDTSGSSCRIAYDWQPGRSYTMRTEKLNSESNGTWWAGYVKDDSTGIETKIAQIKVPLAWKGHGGWSVMWTEYFGAQPATCEQLPYSRVMFGAPTANGGTVNVASTSNYLNQTADCRNSSITAGTAANSWIHQMGNANFSYPDSTAPVVAITQPAANSTVSSPVSISANASDSIGVVKMEILADGTLIKTSNSNTITGSWTAPAAKGKGKNRSKSHTITVRAYDAAGNVGTRSIQVTVR